MDRKKNVRKVKKGQPTLLEEWLLSVLSGSINASGVHFDSAALNTGALGRASEFSVRCVQE